MTRTTYDLELFTGGKKITIPEFETENSARLAGIFLQTLRDDITLFEISEIVHTRSTATKSTRQVNRLR